MPAFGHPAAGTQFDRFNLALVFKPLMHVNKILLKGLSYIKKRSGLFSYYSADIHVVPSTFILLVLPHLKLYLPYLTKVGGGTYEVYV